MAAVGGATVSQVRYADLSLCGAQLDNNRVRAREIAALLDASRYPKTEDSAEKCGMGGTGLELNAVRNDTTTTCDDLPPPGGANPAHLERNPLKAIPDLAFRGAIWLQLPANVRSNILATAKSTLSSSDS